MSLVYLAVVKMVLRGATAEIRVGCRPWSRVKGDFVVGGDVLRCVVDFGAGGGGSFRRPSSRFRSFGGQTRCLLPNEGRKTDWGTSTSTEERWNW